MKKLALALTLSALGCEQNPTSTPAPSQTSALEVAGELDANNELEQTADAPLETPAPAPGECGGLVGVQRIVLQPTEDGDPKKFRFGTEPDALVYETEWTGDLNDDGAEDRIAARRTDGPKTVRMVLVGCKDEFAVAFVGVATSIAVAPEATTVNEREWKNLAVNAGGGVKTLKFDGQKYSEP